jgi:hypothetical protein
MRYKYKIVICGLEASFPGPIVIFLLRERNIIDMQNGRGKNSHREKNSHSSKKVRPPINPVKP